MQTIAVGGLHDHRVCLFERLGIVEQRRTAWSQIAGKHDDLPVTILRHGQLNTRRSNHVTGINEARLNTARDFKSLVVFDGRAERLELAHVSLLKQWLEWR